ncbi:hypothetical protein C8R46DRAFT_1041433 [Mycena filopes]|nr:hypothetical protein C8R46DRAFT_1041433 [Mycena filopes]
MSVLLFADHNFERTSTPPDLFPELFKHSWNLFLPLVLHGEDYAQELEAINAGALILFVSHAQKHVGWSDPELETLITTILLPMTLYYPVLSAIEAALPALEEATSTAAFMSSPLYPAWQDFVTLARERIKIKNWVDSDARISYKACDNLMCGKILPKSSFKRCSGCGYHYYCCKECQVADWRNGHRNHCAITRPPDGWYAPHLDGPAFCTARDRTLIRAILLHDYEAQKERVFLSRVVKMREHGLGITTIWQYDSGRARFTVAPDPNYTDNRDWAARAFRSGGKIHVNYVVPGEWVVLLRSELGEVNRGLYVVAQSLAPGTVEETLPDSAIVTVKRCVQNQGVELELNVPENVHMKRIQVTHRRRSQHRTERSFQLCRSSASWGM